MPLAGMQNEKTIVNLVELTSRAHSRWSCRSIADATPSLVRTLKIYEDRIQWHGSPRFILCQWWDALCSDQVSCLDAWDSVLLQILCRVKEISLHRLKVLIVRLALDIQLVSCQANRSTVQNPHWGWVFAANTLSSTLTRPCHKQSIDYTHMHQVKIESDIFFSYLLTVQACWRCFLIYCCPGYASGWSRESMRASLWQRTLQT